MRCGIVTKGKWDVVVVSEVKKRISCEKDGVNSLLVSLLIFAPNTWLKRCYYTLIFIMEVMICRVKDESGCS
jgi:hypothetical protein